MKKVLAWIAGAGALVAVLFSGAIGQLVGKSSVESYYAGKKDGTLEAALGKAASELNAKLPMMVDAETRLDSSMGTNKTFRYNYTLVNHTSSTVSPAQVVEALERKLTNNVCTSSDMKVFVNNGVVVSYAYFGSDGKQIAIITVPPAKCTNR